MSKCTDSGTRPKGRWQERICNCGSAASTRQHGGTMSMIADAHKIESVVYLDTAVLIMRYTYYANIQKNACHNMV